MQEKLLGKYQIIEEESSSVKIAHYNESDYRIEIVSKPPQSGKYSEIARNINSVSHKNISNLRIEEDDSNFYFVDKDFGEGYSELKAGWFGGNYVPLIKCYLQIIDAVDFIHQRGFYHGNINPKKLIADMNDNAYLLDFGRCYIYAILNDKPDTQFYSPEQITKNECLKESDIYSLGLCMLTILIESCRFSFSFLEEYRDFNSLENIYGKIADEEENLDKINAGLFLLIKKMLEIEPEKRVSLINIQQELNGLLKSILPYKTFAIQVHKPALTKWRENHDCDRYTETQNIQQKIDGSRAYWEFALDDNGRQHVHIAVGDVVFYCSGDIHDKSGHLRDCFFCFKINETPYYIEKLQKYGLQTDDEFVIIDEKQAQEERPGYDSAYEAIMELEERFSQKQRKDQMYETDKKSIETEEDILKAETKALNKKKNTRSVILKGLDTGSDTITLEFIPGQDNTLEGEDPDNTEISKKDEKDFKIGQKVILQSPQDSQKELGGTILQAEAGQSVTVQLEKYAVSQNMPANSGNKDSFKNDEGKDIFLKKGKEYVLTYDYKIEEILLNKRSRALEELQNGNARIPNFLRKINRPQEFIKNDLIDVPKFYNKYLDEDQKRAVQKALSLADDCEAMVLQGPPGTGKTTVITEIVTQILKTRPNEKILVASQSNQAVDNVLERICDFEDKILRIGNNLQKISGTAQNYTPDKVLNKIIKENIQRIDTNPVMHKNPGIQTKMEGLQKDFREKLQHITSQMGRDANPDKKNKESDLATLFTRNIRLIFGTLLGISSWNKFKEMAFDTIIVDEAGRATLSELLVPCIKAHKLILVGDHKQLAPVIDDDVLEEIDNEDEAKTSFFQRFLERIESADRENLKHMLVYNYRTARPICNLYSEAFYDGGLKTAEEINSSKRHKLSFPSSAVWYDTAKLQDKEDTQEGTGKINKCNARIIERTLKQITDEMSLKNIKYDIGIITPYKAQMELLKSQLALKKNYADYEIDIGTVDSFQGSERDIIIYDCVRSGRRQKAKIDFIAEEKRLNVSLSRAKLLLIIVGDRDFLYEAMVSDKTNPFRDIIRYIANNKEEYTIIEEEQNDRKTK